MAPKIVDHEARREAVHEAVWRVIGRVGLDAASTREIAREAGLSLGALNHYFADKDELLISAHELGFRRARERILETGRGKRGLAALRHALFESLPLDEERLLEAHVDISFAAHAVTNPRMAAVRRESHAEVRRLLYGVLGEASAAGELRDGVDAERTVDEYLTLVDGASVDALMYGLTTAYRDRQVALAEAFLARLAA
ncbi:TetR/AcrR family transcriptional regulator [Demequina sp. NBRC 110056]|uniref:TetR/AcrR family transcriptional regulator n=1 Tax=Demequina sp. NBRC 110056 TaxID=1570345 RepID=UPI000A044420|nr:TetR/AcrR family transcriptional regulator [Demequina sp. NBRC 110056]